MVQVPKSIDNDLWMPLPISTLGFETARHVGVGLVKSLMEDARTTGRWYLGVTMGRPTGHLTLGIGKAASATCTIIPEEFAEGSITCGDIADIVEGCIIKRRAMGKSHGVVLLAEALVERFSPREVAELQDVDRDAQGNIRVTEIDLGRKVKNEVQVRLEARGIKVTIVDKTIGYELRCAPPIPFDAEYARDLGFAAVRHLIAGGSGALDHHSRRRVPADPVRGCGRQRQRPRPAPRGRRAYRKLLGGPRLHGQAGAARLRGCRVDRRAREGGRDAGDGLPHAFLTVRVAGLMACASTRQHAIRSCRGLRRCGRSGRAGGW